MTDEQLSKLRKEFAHEVKRNLYEAYLRPHETLIKLVSTSISSSAAFPGGEAFHFAFSANGQYVLAYSTSRIHVLHFADLELTVERELKILRRPASVAILDDGSILAVLSTDHQVDLYDLSDGKPKHIRAIALDHHPRTISLSPGGAVLAAAYDGGIEVYSLADTALATDKRGVKSDAADSLSFSKDGTQLLGTTLNSKNPSTVILTAPYFNPGEHSPEDSISQLWTTSILFPNSSRDCSHAALLPSSTDYEVNWTFTYDRVFETFRAVRIDDLRNGTTYFTGPVADMMSSSKLLPSTLPATTGSGDLVAAGFKGKEIWCYGVPEDLDAPPDIAQSAFGVAEADSSVSTPSLTRRDSLPGPGLRGAHTWPKESKESRIPQWQILCDKSRNTFVEGRQVSELEGITALKWATTPLQSSRERLIAAAPGGVGMALGQSFEMEEDGMAPMDGGRLLLLDFSYSIANGQKRTITIEVGEKEPEVLEEERRDLETEVAIVRRRTVAQNREHRQAVLRSATIAAHTGHGHSTRTVAGVAPALPRMPSTRKIPLSPTEERSETASMASVDEQEALDAPYAHGAPRSGTTLRRAATAAALNRVLHPPRVAPQEPPRMRPADGRNELPHESDADNWVPPPPPYSREPIPPLPEHLRNAIPAGIMAAPNTLHRSSTQRSAGSTDSDVLSSLRRSRSTYAAIGRSPPLSPPATVSRRASVSSAVSASSDPGRETATSNTAGNNDDFDDLYDVSPQRTPEPVVAVPFVPPPVNHIPQPPLGQSAPAPETVPEIPVRNITTAELVSPIPRHAVLNRTVQNINIITEQLNSVSDNGSTVIGQDIRPLSTGPTTLTQSRLDTAMPSQPNNDHNLTELPPVTPLTPMNLFGPAPDRRASLQTPSDPVPVNLTQSTADVASIDLSLPSASQLARLNSRGAMTNRRSLVDPSRRGSTAFMQSQINPATSHNEPSAQYMSNDISQTLPNHMNSGPPRAAVGAYSSPTYVSPICPSPPAMQHNLGRLVTQHNARSLSFSATSPRPRLSRLETIHSINSNAEPTAYVSNTTRAIPVGVSRQTSRAERSAAMNIKEAKRKGWRGTMRKKEDRKKDRDGASSAGWTDVSKDSVYNGIRRKRKDKGGKCTFM